MSTARALRYTEAEYLALSEASSERLEFVNGEVLAMAGASPVHELLVASMIAALYARLKGTPCRPYASNLRVKISETGLYCYPDLTVVCGKLETAPTRPVTALNPKVIVEVLSDSTEAYDRGAKARHYRQLGSLEAYILVSANARAIEVHTREPGGWTLHDPGQGGEVHIPALGITFNLEEIYAVIEELEPLVIPEP